MIIPLLFSINILYVTFYSMPFTDSCDIILVIDMFYIVICYLFIDNRQCQPHALISLLSYIYTIYLYTENIYFQMYSCYECEIK